MKDDQCSPQPEGLCHAPAARLRATLDSMADGVMVLDRQGRILYLNTVAPKFLPSRPESLSTPMVGVAYQSFFPKPDEHEAAQAVAAVLDNSCERSHRFFVPISGRWCEARYLPHEEGVTVILQDVTNEARELELRSTQARVLSLIHGGSELPTVLDELVRGCEKVLPGALVSVQEVLPDGWRTRHVSAVSLPKSYIDGIDSQTIDADEGLRRIAQQSQRYIVPDLAADPTWVPFRDLALEHGLRSCWAVRMLDSAGNILGSVAVYHREPATPSRDELELIDQVAHLASLAVQAHYQEAALRESQERFRQMDEAIDDVFWMEDIASGRLIYLSPTFEKLSGYSPAAYDESPAHWETLVHPEDRERVLAEIAQSHRDWSMPAEGLRYRIIRADGEVRWVNDRAFLIRDGEGNPWRISGVIRDITEQLNLERQLRESQRMESLGQLTGGIAHDFNNLLTVILGNSELLADELEGQPRLAQLAKMVESAAQRGSELTQRLLAFARRQPLEPRLVAVQNLVDDMLPLLRRSLGQHVYIRLDHEPDLPLAIVDPSQLENALLNLCLNGRDAMSAGGVLTIETRHTRFDGEDNLHWRGLAAGDYLRLSVSDTGRGIAAADLEHIFEPFFTTKEKSKGTGLGLAMVYGFARQSRGQITVYSEVGIGTTFHLYLPCAQGTALMPRGDSSAAVASPSAEWILLVEDNVLVRDYVHSQLTELGYRVHVAASGHKALELLRGGAPVDLLFTDVVMPGGVSGPELARRARMIRPGLPVLYTSGYTENALESHGQLPSEILLLSKPYRRKELAEKLRRALAREP